MALGDAILVCLTERPMTGYELAKTFDSSIGFFWKADVQEQKRWVRKHRRHKRAAGPETRRYFVDACHPVSGVDLLYSCPSYCIEGRTGSATV